MGDYCKRSSGEIPAFGDWDYANELPITQYFECARQAGVIRFTSSTGKPKTFVHGDLYAVDFKTKHSRKHVPVRKVSRFRENRGRGGGGGGPLATEEKTAGSVCDVTEPARKYKHRHRHLHHGHVATINNINNNKTSKHLENDVVYPKTTKRLPVTTIPKPVDEDLYKIPPEILHSSNRKKIPGFFSCLVPSCAT